MSTASGSHARRLLGRIGAGLDRLTFGPEQPLLLLEAIRTYRELLELAEAGCVQAALKSGYGYGEIGTALGISRQAARQQHLRRVEKDGREPFDKWVDVQKRKRRAA